MMIRDTEIRNVGLQPEENGEEIEKNLKKPEESLICPIILW